ncbi:Beta-phosphoglucomutase [Caloramator mitchellensis]|uniref:Beta-phosphoglucomutase n=1 Tax=Caloramator mitchellensis TaxID=908809 RepID=A0A0R3K0L2_CALMK|nr:HAD family phosphatase [Caloramator mitchellensis]KRQ86402.1 Beta-phosphoglucomutase [Caloramator mitchellensis]
MIKAVIFDMDGVLIDNYEYHCIAWKEFARRRNINLSDEEIIKNFGRTNKEIFAQIFKRELNEDEVITLGEEKERVYREVYKEYVKPVDGLVDYLKFLKQKEIKTAVASSAPIENIDFILDELDIRNYIDAIAHAGMIKNGKPDPEIFLKAAEILGVEPRDCIVFEDSLAGIEAGVRAGMKVFGVATTYPKEKLTMAHETIDNFKKGNHWNI